MKIDFLNVEKPLHKLYSQPKVETSYKNRSAVPKLEKTEGPDRISL